MPPILERLVGQLEAKGYDKSASFAIATKGLQRSGNLKKGTQEATAKGKRRGLMSPGERAKDRAAKYSKKKPKAFKYISRTNTAVLKRAT